MTLPVANWKVSSSSLSLLREVNNSHLIKESDFLSAGTDASAAPLGGVDFSRLMERLR